MDLCDGQFDDARFGIAGGFDRRHVVHSAIDAREKEKSGVLQSVETRRKFPTDLDHRIRFVYVPKHTSWLNPVEIWFGGFSRQLLKRGNFRSKEDLREQVWEYIEYQNRVHAKVYKWTYTGRPLAA